MIVRISNTEGLVEEDNTLMKKREKTPTNIKTTLISYVSYKQ